jgi:hypothetical protein
MYKYSGSGSLSKTAGYLPVDICAVRYWTQNGSPERPLILDFSGSDVLPVDSLETNQTISVVRVQTPGVTGSIVQQVDSLAVPLQVDLVKEGRTVRSFAASSWKKLSLQSIPEFSFGDILRFSLAPPSRKTRGYLQVSLRGSAAQKVKTPDQTVEVLSPSPNTLNAYPNPFNPSTRLLFQLSEPGVVKLTIYDDVLGREVEELVSGMTDAGTHTVLWDASKLASGVYYARLTIGDELNRAKLTRVSRLVLMK